MTQYMLVLFPFATSLGDLQPVYTKARRKLKILEVHILQRRIHIDSGKHNSSSLSVFYNDSKILGCTNVNMLFLPLSHPFYLQLAGGLCKDDNIELELFGIPLIIQVREVFNR